MADPRLIDLSGSIPEPEHEAAFYFDLSDPECWLVAERIIQELGRPAPWIPVLGSALAPASSGDPAGSGDGASRLGLAEVGERASQRGLLELRPPEDPQAPDRDAMLAATYARQAGKVVAFTLAAMRQCWCAGRSISDRSTLLLAGAAAEIHPNALEKALSLKSLAAELDRQTSAASELGVGRVPAVRVGRTIHFGDDGMDAAGRTMAR